MRKTLTSTEKTKLRTATPKASIKLKKQDANYHYFADLVKRSAKKVEKASSKQPC